MADEQSARRAWDPSHQSATVERHVKIRACLDLTTVLLRVPSAYRGVLSDLFAKYTDKVEQKDVLTRARTKLQGLKERGEVPFSYNSLRLPTVQYQKGSHDLWNETWSLPGSNDLKEFKKVLMDRELTLLTGQIERLNQNIDEREAVKEAWEALAEAYKKRPKQDHFRVVLPQAADSAEWPEIPTFEVSTTNDLKNELQALQVDLPVYFRKVYDLKLDLVERIHGPKEKKAEEKRKVDVEMKDAASSSSKETSAAINQEVQRQIAAAFKNLPAPGPSSFNKKVSESVRVPFRMNPTHIASPGRKFETEESQEAQGLQEGEKGEGESFLHPLSQGGYLEGQETLSWRRQRSQEEWATRRAKRQEEAAVEVLKRKPWTFGVPSSYPDELLSLPHSRQVEVLLSRAPITLLDSNRFRSPVHVQPLLDVPMGIQHDLSASLKFMFETQIDASLIQKAYSDLVRRIRWKWHFIDQVGEDYDPDYDVSGKLDSPDKRSKQPPEAHPHIERGLRAGQDYVSHVMTSIPGVDMARRTPVPLNLKRAREFMVKNNLIVTSTDKNLGVAVFKREWIYDQACQLFNDADNYTSLSVQEAVDYLSLMANAIRELCEIHLSDYKQLSTFLSHCIPDASGVSEWTNWKDYVPEAYAIPKIHKNPWKGRPICPGHSLPQNPASKVLAKTIRPYIEQCPWVIKGSKDFVKKLADVKIPQGRKAYIVSADVVAFYPSVDTKKLREILNIFAEKTIIPDEMARGNHSPEWAERRLDYYNRLFEIALAEPVMTFNERIVCQTKGLPMGAAGSPDAANIFGIWFEFEWIEKVTGNDDILFYGRYLDDIYNIVLAEGPDEALEMLSFISLGDVKLLWEPPSDQANFLDLSTRIQGDRIFHEPFVKAMSHRERIPWSSAHPLDVKKGTFSSEISRLATLCSDHTTYINQCQEAVNLYIGRGYPPALVTKWLKGQQQKRWEDRVAEKSVEDPARTFFTLKTHFNEAWKSFNVGELESRIISHWRGYTPTRVAGKKRRHEEGQGDTIPRPRKRVRVALTGQQWPGQSRLAFAQEDGSDVAEGIRVSAGPNPYDFSSQQVAKWTQKWIDHGKFLVSRRKNTQLWDLTRTWNEAVWDNFMEEGGMHRPFSPSYEGLVVPDENGE